MHGMKEGKNKSSDEVFLFFSAKEKKRDKSSLLRIFFS